MNGFLFPILRKRYATAAVVINGGSAPITIENMVFDRNRLGVDRGVDIQNYTGAIIVRNCVFLNFKGTNQCYSAYFFNISNLTLENCYIENTCLGVRVGSSTLTNCIIRNNLFRNIDQTGVVSIGASGSSAIQLTNCTGTGIRINNNSALNTAGLAGDTYSLYAVQGTAGDYVQFYNNTAKSLMSSPVPSNYTGGSIVVENNSRYIHVRDFYSENASGWGGQTIGNTRDVIWENMVLLNRYRNNSFPANGLGYSSGGFQYEVQAGNENLNTFINNVSYGVVRSQSDGSPIVQHWYAVNKTFTPAEFSTPQWLVNIHNQNLELLP